MTGAGRTQDGRFEGVDPRAFYGGRVGRSTERGRSRGVTTCLVTLLVALTLPCCFAMAGRPQVSASSGGGGFVLRDRTPPFRFFAPDSPWNKSLSPDAPLDPLSGPIMARFRKRVRRETRAETGPNIETTRWSVPIYTVPRDEPTVRVAQSNPKSFSPTLQSAWDEVPLPADAEPAGGTDEHLVVWQPGTNRLWEFWRLRREAGGWAASWGGAMRNVSKNWGFYGPGAWPGATYAWGGSASSLSLAGGVVTFEDMSKGTINHALALVIPGVREGVYSLPARRTDGEVPSRLALPEGAHLRLDPRLDLASLGLPPFTLMLARAAQRYGIFIRSKSGQVGFLAQDPPTLADPYEGPQGYFEGWTQGELAAAFPWKHLQLLPMRLR
jgi:hypothetical protein